MFQRLTLLRFSLNPPAFQHGSSCTAPEALPDSNSLLCNASRVLISHGPLTMRTP
jgi:hypothetical protein